MKWDRPWLSGYRLPGVILSEPETQQTIKLYDLIDMKLAQLFDPCPSEEAEDRQPEPGFFIPILEAGVAEQLIYIISGEDVLETDSMVSAVLVVSCG